MEPCDSYQGQEVEQGLVPSEKRTVGGGGRMLNKIPKDFRIQGK